MTGKELKNMVAQLDDNDSVILGDGRILRVSAAQPTRPEALFVIKRRRFVKAVPNVVIEYATAKSWTAAPSHAVRYSNPDVAIDRARVLATARIPGEPTVTVERLHEKRYGLASVVWQSEQYTRHYFGEV